MPQGEIERRTAAADKLYAAGALCDRHAGALLGVIADINRRLANGERP